MVFSNFKNIFNTLLEIIHNNKYAINNDELIPIKTFIDQLGNYTDFYLNVG